MTTTNKLIFLKLAGLSLLAGLLLCSGCGAGAGINDSQTLQPAASADEDIASGVEFNGSIEDSDNTGSSVKN